MEDKDSFIKSQMVETTILLKPINQQTVVSLDNQVSCEHKYKAPFEVGEKFDPTG